MGFAANHGSGIVTAADYHAAILEGLKNFQAALWKRGLQEFVFKDEIIKTEKIGAVCLGNVFLT